MNDAVFTLTPHDIRAQQFATALRGLDRAAVEAFKDKVAEEFERLLRERAQTEERLRNFQEQLRAFRDRERAMNDALLAAQQLRADIEHQAARKAETLLAQAKVEAERLVGEASRQEAVVRDRADTARRQFHAYLGSLRTILERQLADLEGLEQQVRVSHGGQTTG